MIERVEKKKYDRNIGHKNLQNKYLFVGVFHLVRMVLERQISKRFFDATSRLVLSDAQYVVVASTLDHKDEDG